MKRGRAAKRRGVVEAGSGSVPYRETEHYKVAKAFLTQTRQMLKVLLENETPEAS